MRRYKGSFNGCVTKRPCKGTGSLPPSSLRAGYCRLRSGLACGLGCRGRLRAAFLVAPAAHAPSSSRPPPATTPSTCPRTTCRPCRPRTAWCACMHACKHGAGGVKSVHTPHARMRACMHWPCCAGAWIAPRARAAAAAPRSFPTCIAIALASVRSSSAPRGGRALQPEALWCGVRRPTAASRRRSWPT